MGIELWSKYNRALITNFDTDVIGVGFIELLTPEKEQYIRRRELPAKDSQCCIVNDCWLC